jgi:hypothetical protein
LIVTGCHYIGVQDFLAFGEAVPQGALAIPIAGFRSAGQTIIRLNDPIGLRRCRYATIVDLHPRQEANQGDDASKKNHQAVAFLDAIFKSFFGVLLLVTSLGCVYCGLFCFYVYDFSFDINDCWFRWLGINRCGRAGRLGWGCLFVCGFLWLAIHGYSILFAPRISVSQKLLTLSGFSYYTKYMANVLGGQLRQSSRAFC